MTYLTFIKSLGGRDYHDAYFTDQQSEVVCLLKFAEKKTAPTTLPPPSAQKVSAHVSIFLSSLELKAYVLC